LPLIFNIKLTWITVEGSAMLHANNKGEVYRICFENIFCITGIFNIFVAPETTG
jgi:hypothetical protein